MAASYSPIPYTGNKACIAADLISFIPKHITYMEPCAGSAEIFFRKAPSPREILNDYSNDVVNLYRTMQCEEKLLMLLGRLCLSISSEELFKRNKEYLESIPNVLDDLNETVDEIKNATEANIEQAAAFIENQVYSFSSTGQSYGIEARDMAKRINRFIAARSRIANACILHRDYKDAMIYAADENTFYLIDPPYRKTENSYPKGNFSSEEFRQLIRLVAELDRKYGVKFIITYNTDPDMIELAQSYGFQTKVLDRLDGMRQATDPGSQYHELLIANYDMDEQAEKNRGIVISKTNQMTLFRSE